VLSTAKLHPYDEDLKLVFLRTVRLNVDSYWVRSMEKDLRDVPCGPHLSYMEEGNIFLELPESQKERKKDLAICSRMARAVGSTKPHPKQSVR